MTFCCFYRCAIFYMLPSAHMHYLATQCVSAVFAVAWCLTVCPSVHPSVCLSVCCLSVCPMPIPKSRLEGRIASWKLAGAKPMTPVSRDPIYLEVEKSKVKVIRSKVKTASVSQRLSTHLSDMCSLYRNLIIFLLFCTVV